MDCPCLLLELQGFVSNPDPGPGTGLAMPEPDVPLHVEGRIVLRGSAVAFPPTAREERGRIYRFSSRKRFLKSLVFIVNNCA